MIKFAKTDENKQYISILLASKTYSAHDLYYFLVDVYPSVKTSLYKKDNDEILLAVNEQTSGHFGFSLNDLRSTVERWATDRNIEAPGVEMFTVDLSRQFQRRWHDRRYSKPVYQGVQTKLQSISFNPTMTLTERRSVASAAVKNAFTIGTKRIAYIPVDLMHIQPYQRDRQRYILDIAEHWDDSKCNVLTVAYDKDKGWFNVIDGQHRAAAAKMRGIEYLVCEILDGLNMSSESALFVDSNISSKKLSPFDTFKANMYITGDDETEMSKIDKQIAKICDKYGVNVKKSQACNTIKSVPHVRKIMQREGERCLMFIIETIQKSQWDKYKNGYCYIVEEALRQVYNAHIDNLEETKCKLAKYLIAHSPDDIDAIGNKLYPGLKRMARWSAILSGAAA